MKRILPYSVLAIVFSVWPFSQAAIPELTDYPDQYIVKRGDTLWDIATIFLAKPWHWPAIWQVNAQIENPHLIYPGDQLSLVYQAGKPQLEISRKAVRLGPSMRISPLPEPIRALPSVSPEVFYDRSQIISFELLDTAARVVSLSDGRLMNTDADELMVVGDLPEQAQSYAIYRPSDRLIDPQSKELLGIQMDFIANIEQLQSTGALALFSATLKDGRREVRVGDSVLLKVAEKSTSRVLPQQSSQPNGGQIISTAGHQQLIGQYDSVTINRGAREKTKVGDVLLVKQPAVRVYDPVGRKSYQVPGQEMGVMMVYQVFEKASYGMIMEAQQPIKVLDNIAAAD